MNVIDRRSMMRSILGGAAAAAVVGVALMPNAIEAAPALMDKSLSGKSDDLVQEAQVVVVGPRRRRHRRRVCWWRRGRRVCAWR